MYNRLLKIILTVAAFGWGISIIGVLVPWSVAIEGLKGLGAGDIPNDPMLNYWLRMAGGGFTLVGIIYAAILIKPGKYGVIIPLMASLSIFEGVILLIAGLYLRLPFLPFWGDTSFCLGVGISLLIIYPKALKENRVIP